MEIVEIAKDYAIRKHHDVNHTYDKGRYPYDYHLNMVVQIALEHIDLIPEQDRADVLAGCWVHDIIEDARETYNDVKKNTNEVVAEYAYALTNEKGRTREDRANDRYYRGIRHYKHAIFIKICDRIANMRYSKETGSSMFEKYQKEMDHFYVYLYNGNYKRLWQTLKTLAEYKNPRLRVE